MITNPLIPQSAMEILKQKHLCGINTLAVFKNDYILSGGYDGSLAVLHVPTESFFIANSSKAVHKGAIHSITIYDEFVVTTSDDCQSIWDPETWHCHDQIELPVRHNFRTVLRGQEALQAVL